MAFNFALSHQASDFQINLSLEKGKILKPHLKTLDSVPLFCFPYEATPYQQAKIHRRFLKDLNDQYSVKEFGTTYCQICDKEVDYFEHVISKKHLKKMKQSNANQSIDEMMAKYKRVIKVLHVFD